MNQNRFLKLNHNIVLLIVSLFCIEYTINNLPTFSEIIAKYELPLSKGNASIILVFIAFFAVWGSIKLQDLPNKQSRNASIFLFISTFLWIVFVLNYQYKYLFYVALFGTLIYSVAIILSYLLNYKKIESIREDIAIEGISKQIKYNIKQRIKENCYNNDDRNIIPLKKEIKQKYINNNKSSAVQFKAIDCELDNNITIEEIYNEYANGRLLIIGEPGGGKTFFMLQIANYIASIETDKHLKVPIIFDLGFWDGSMSMTEWVKKEVFNSFKDLSEEIWEKLWKENKIVFLFDGLDQVADIEKCVVAINNFADTHTLRSIIVACRYNSYKESAKKMNLNSAILIHQTDDILLENYFSNTGNTEIWDKLKTNTMVKSIIYNPFFLFVLMRIKATKNLNQIWNNTKNKNKLKDFLLDCYVSETLDAKVNSTKKFNIIERIFKFLGSNFYSEQSSKKERFNYLMNFSKILKENKIDNFFYQEHLQGDLLPSNLEKKNFKYTFVMLTLGLIGTGGIMLLVNWLRPNLILVLIQVVILIIISLFLGYTNALTKIEPTKILMRKLIKERSILNLFFLFFLYKVGFEQMVFAISYQHGKNAGITAILAFNGLIALITIFLARVNQTKLKLPNEDIDFEHKFFTWSFGFIFLSMLLMFFIGMVMAVIDNKITLKLAYAMILVCILPLIFCIGIYIFLNRSFLRQKLILHFFSKNNTLPFNLMPFLDFASQSRILQRDGVNYRFIHNHLKEHFEKNINEGVVLGDYEKVIKATPQYSSIKEELESLIFKGDMNEALKRLLPLTKSDNDKQKSIKMQITRWKRADTDIEKNKITAAVLELINELEI